MYKICHIRCDGDYWLKQKPHSYTIHKEKEWSNFNFKDVISFWDNTLKIPYFIFRKQIRDLVIDHIRNKCFFDYIFENNEDFNLFVQHNDIKDYLLYQQDDDDILVQIPFFQYGANIYNYSFIDVLNMRRQSSKEVCIRQILHNNKQQYNVQSNHSLVVFKDSKPIKDFVFLEHTGYDEIIKNYPVSFHNEVLGLQIYHLFSQSLWFSYSKDPKNIINEQVFYAKALEFINKFSLLKEMKNYPLLYQFNTAYSKLI